MPPTGSSSTSPPRRAHGAPSGSVVVIGDEYGALTLGAADAGATGIRVHQDSLAGERALEANARTAGLGETFRSLPLDGSPRRGCAGRPAAPPARAGRTRRHRGTHRRARRPRGRRVRRRSDQAHDPRHERCAGAVLRQPGRVPRAAEVPGADRARSRTTAAIPQARAARHDAPGLSGAAHASARSAARSREPVSTSAPGSCSNSSPGPTPMNSAASWAM